MGARAGGASARGDGCCDASEVDPRSSGIGEHGTDGGAVPSCGERWCCTGSPWSSIKERQQRGKGGALERGWGASRRQGPTCQRSEEVTDYGNGLKNDHYRIIM